VVGRASTRPPAATSTGGVSSAPRAIQEALPTPPFGWKSQPAIQRLPEAVAEIRRVARKDVMLGAEGAVLFLEKVSSAIEQVDGSSGAIGLAVAGSRGAGTRSGALSTRARAHA
jgi:hypothetical protein